MYEAIKGCLKRWMKERIIDYLRIEGKKKEVTAVRIRGYNKVEVFYVLSGARVDLSA